MSRPEPWAYMGPHEDHGCGCPGAHYSNGFAELDCHLEDGELGVYLEVPDWSWDDATTLPATAPLDEMLRRAQDWADRRLDQVTVPA